MKCEQPEAGFTLIELLVVLVIMPLIIGAIAAAIIISEQDSGVASGRLSDSASAQTFSEYYVRDVQGAGLVTTDAAAASPTQVCGAGTVPNQSLVLGLYRAPTASSNVLSVGYWLIPQKAQQVNSQPVQYELVRDSCDSGESTPSQLVITNDVTSPDQVTGTIAPAQFNSAAAQGWTATTTTTDNISVVSISVTEPGSGYTYSLQATPRVWTSQVSGDAAPGMGSP